MGFFAFIGMTIIIGFTLYGLYTYVTQQDEDDNQ